MLRLNIGVEQNDMGIISGEMGQRCEQMIRVDESVLETTLVS